MNINVSMNNKIYTNTLQHNSNISNRAPSQTAFKAGNSLPKTIVKNKSGSTLEKMKLFLQRTFCKPSEDTLDDYCNDLRNMFYLYNVFDVNDKVITKIFSMLDIHSKNPKYTDFVKEGIAFLERVKKSEENGGPIKFYTGRAYDFEKSHGTVYAANKDGAQLFDTITFAIKKAIRPNSEVVDYFPHSGYVDDNRLQNYIKDSRIYMTEFES